MKMEFTARGQKFSFCDPYYDAVSAVRPLDAVATLPIFEAGSATTHKRATEAFTFARFLGKFYEAAVLLEVLRSAGLRGPIRRALDIGSGPALQPRILKLARVCDWVEAVDIYDGRRQCPDPVLQLHARKLQAMSFLVRMVRFLPAVMRRRVTVLNKLDTKWPVGANDFGFHPAGDLYKSRVSWSRSLDHYHVGDVYALRSGYDLVTSFMALEYLDFQKLAAKVCELLNPGGLFAFFVSYWWYPVNNTLLYGRFPYLLQQLAAEEVEAYYRAVHPDVPLSGLARRLHHSDPLQPTVADYERLAFAQGLVPLRTVRLHPDHFANERAVMGPLRINDLPGCSLEGVLRNCQERKPELCLADLMTSHVVMLFSKR